MAVSGGSWRPFQEKQCTLYSGCLWSKRPQATDYDRLLLSSSIVHFKLVETESETQWRLLGKLQAQ